MSLSLSLSLSLYTKISILCLKTCGYKQTRKSFAVAKAQQNIYFCKSALAKHGTRKRLKIGIGLRALLLRYFLFQIQTTSSQALTNMLLNINVYHVEKNMLRRSYELPIDLLRKTKP